MSKFYIETLGCPKNINDSEYASGVLTEKGYEEVDSPEDADFVIVNTCGFIEDAKRESIDRIFEMTERKSSDAKLIISGCLAQRYADELAKEIPEADCFIGVEQYGNIGKIFDSLSGADDDDSKRDASANESSKIFIDSCNLNYLEKTIRKYKGIPYTSTIKIAEGCNNRCSYCAIPFIRGNYRSKKIEDIIEEAQDLADAGMKELILIAQDVAYYGRDLYGKYMLPELLRELVKIEKIKWIRLMYCYDDRITDELIDVIATEEKVLNYIDIPIQHGSDRILKAMNRNSDNASIREVIGKLRDRIPDIAIRTSMIVGFPGETEEDFEDLIDLVEDVEFTRLGAFKYSKEEGTKAAEMTGQIPDDVKEKRWNSLMRRQMDISLKHNQSMIGTVQEVIIDDIEEDDGIFSDLESKIGGVVYVGRTRYDAPEIDNGVVIQSTKKLNVGDIVKVKILDAFDYDLVAEYVG